MEKHKLQNFIPISRRLFQHQLWCEERAFSRFEAWIYLLKEARFEDSKVYDGNQLVEVRRGQIYASIRFLAEAFGWSRNKTMNFIGLLQADSMIVKEIVSQTGQMRLTVCNYDRYNASGDSSGTSKGREDDTAGTKSNRENKEKREKTSSSEGELWRENYDIYLKEGKEALARLLTDEEFIAGRERFRPNLDVRLSLQKAYEDYWQTREAWNRRRKRRLKLDWRVAFKHALDIPQNWITGGLCKKNKANNLDQIVDYKGNKINFDGKM